MRDAGSDERLGWTGIAGELWLPPDAAVLVSAPDGTVVRASEQAAELAGEVTPEGLVGQRMSQLLVRDGAVWRLRGRGPGVSAVRTVSWQHGDDERLRVTVLLDVSDLTVALSRMSPAQRARLLEVDRTTMLGDPSLRDAQHAARIGTWQWDPAADVLELSDTLSELTGRSHTSFEDFLAAVDPDDRAWVREAWSPLVAHHHPVEVEHRYVRPDGAVRIFRVHGTPTRDADGNVVLAGTAQDITDQRETGPPLQYRARHDVVTGLPNRTAARELLQQLLEGARAATVAVLAVRIDNFKRVITSLGHEVGDDLLAELARRLAEGLGEESTIARVSGEDEFVVLCSDLAVAGGLDALTGRVSGLVRTPVPVRDQFLNVSASIGVAVHDDPRRGGGDLLRFATAAMGQARQRGPGQVRQATTTLMDSVDHQVDLEGQLRQALHRDELSVHYQPILAADGAILAAEALVRWPHPERGLLTPGAFLTVADQAGLLRELDQWVLRTALGAAARWSAPNGRPVDIAINLSGLVPGDPAFADLIAEAVAEAGFDWHRVILELVEEELAVPHLQTQHGMLSLARRGARFAIDDFGTGYSSLARFKQLPAELIKIDRQFVAGITDDPADRAVTESMIGMAKALGRRCIAEGVETADQFHLLDGLGVDAYQGWLFTPALPEAEFTTLLANSPLPTPPSASADRPLG
ncbi:putative bifunctional diguanylate cyclase/phosphodiesterase [Saccharopolyspora sp. CA-218241]|uniref:putative bifunctional diguanylate cyclase/phosphodiesterase n=1 Tax=Saccharopolyspora sp. CA-218241 TaxID=3240027 RepID=UPI003D95FF3D